jgi:hypothetical protein
MVENDEHPGVEIQKQLRRTSRSVLGMYAVVILLFAYVLFTAASTRTALCSFHGDLKTRAENSQEFLNMTREERIKEFGETLGSIPTTTIESNLRNQTATLKSLGGLHCDSWLPIPR